MKWDWFWIEDNDDYSAPVVENIEDYLKDRERCLKAISKGNLAILFGLIATIALFINHETAYMTLTESNAQLVLFLNKASVFVGVVALVVAFILGGLKMSAEVAVNIVIFPCMSFPLFPIVLIIGLIALAIDFVLILKVPVVFFFLVKRHAKKKLKENDENIERITKQNATQDMV